MRRHLLGPGSGEISELVFGAASLGGRVSVKTGLDALAAASEAGVNAIDVAPSYGFGAAEAALGKFLRGRRDRFVISTKAGIRPAKVGLAQHYLKAFARPILAGARGLRSRIGRVVAPAAPAVPFSQQEFRASLDSSLRALGLDRVDIFLAHKCPTSKLEYDEFAAFCEHERARGKLALWGICGDIPSVRGVSAHAPPPVAQVPGDVFSTPEGASHGLAQSLVMYFRPFGGGERLRALKARAPRDLSPSERRRWANEVALRGLLRLADTAVPTPAVPAVVVCSMNRTAHVRANADALSHPRLGVDTLDAVLRRIRSEVKS